MSKPGYVLLRGLKHARLHTGLSRIEFAAKIGRAAATLQNWEELDNAAPADMTPKLARECGVPTESLLIGKPVVKAPKKNERKPKGSGKSGHCEHCGQKLNDYNKGPYCLRHHAPHSRRAS